MARQNRKSCIPSCTNLLTKMIMRTVPADADQSNKKVNIPNMRHRFLMFGFLIVCSTNLHGQDNILICSKQISNSVEKSNEILRRNVTYTSVNFVEINLDKILEYEYFSLQLGERNIPIRKERIDARGVNSYVFVGSNNEGCRVLISVLDNDIQGVIEIEEEVYTIKTIGEQQYALMTLDYSLLRESCDDLHEEIDRSSFDDANRLNHDSDIKSDNDIMSSPILRAATAYDCKIRVLVLYTPNAQPSPLESNIKNTILTAVAYANQSFVNSQINYQIELVYAGQTNYTESGNMDTDLFRFKNTEDGYMDEVHTLRNKYSADVCVLLNYIYGKSCGVGFVGVTATNAFCVVNSACDVSNYSFAHEIGHLLGCDHDPLNESGYTTFAYGHGYVNPSKTWRTIMAYGNTCNSCPRLLYWSNPNVTKDGAPMGTVDTHNNARVWNERSNTVMAFRQPNSNVTFTSSDMPNTQYADVIAKQNITTSGTVDTNSGNTLNMRAGNSINLQPGFSVQVGAEFSASIEEIDDCEECVSKIIIQNVPEEYDDMVELQTESKSDFSYTVFPDSSNEFINITYSLDREIPLSIELVDLFGNKIKTILPKQKQQVGNNKLQISVSDFSKGTSFLTISSTNQTKTEKIIINK